MGSHQHTAATNGQLSSAEIDRILLELEENGFAVVQDVVDRGALAAFGDDILGEYRRVRESGELFEGGGMITGHLNCFPGESSRFVHEQLRRRGIVEVARRVDPSAAERPRPTLNFNLPGSVAQHYHVDGPFMKPFLICNVAVVDTDLENGAIDVLPGTHRTFLPFWRYALRRTWRLSTQVPLRRGDAILRLSTTWHRGTPNRTDEPRPLMSITFGEVAAGARDPWTTNEGQVEFYPNWYSTSRTGRLRERTFRVAPISYSTYRFVRSLWGDKGYDSF